MMGRQKSDGNHSPPKNKYRIQREMKKMDTQFQTPTKQRSTMPTNPMKLTRTL
jgi:hypothetical protein